MTRVVFSFTILKQGEYFSLSHFLVSIIERENEKILKELNFSNEMHANCVESKCMTLEESVRVNLCVSLTQIKQLGLVALLYFIFITAVVFLLLLPSLQFILI